MKKILTIGLLAGMAFTAGEKTMASAGSAYTTFRIEEMNKEKKTQAPGDNEDTIKNIEYRGYR